MVLIIIVNVWLLAITLCKYYLPGLPQNWRLFPAFNLAIEMNLAVWWSGLLLMGGGVLALEMHRIDTKNRCPCWLILSGIMLFLSFDEIASFHERVPNLFLVYVGLVIVALLFCTFTRLLRGENRLPSRYILAGFGLFGLVIVQEILEWNLHWPQTIEGIRTALEEGSELFGSTLIIAGLHARKRQLNGKGLNTGIIPGIYPSRNVLGVLSAMAAVSVLFIHLLWPRLHDLQTRGNPAVWFPMLVNFLLFAFFWNLSSKDRWPEKIPARLIAVIFLLCSAGSVYNLKDFFFKIYVLVPEPLLLSFVFYLSAHLGVQVLVIFSQETMSLPGKLGLTALCAAAYLVGTAGKGAVFAWTHIEIYTLFSFMVLTSLLKREMRDV